MLSFRFYLITDHDHSRHKPPAVLGDLVEAGLRALQVREKALQAAALAEYAGNLSQSLGARRGEIALYLNGMPELALSLGFDGVHMRSDSLHSGKGPETLREAVGKVPRFGISTHSLEEVQAAVATGADFATFGPVFATPSKAAYGDPVGLRALEAVARELKSSPSSLPLIALGGVTPDRVKECLAAGASGVAAISAVWNAENPVRALEKFQHALNGL